MLLLVVQKLCFENHYSVLELLYCKYVKPQLLPVCLMAHAAGCHCSYCRMALCQILQNQSKHKYILLVQIEPLEARNLEEVRRKGEIGVH